MFCFYNHFEKLIFVLESIYNNFISNLIALKDTSPQLLVIIIINFFNQK